MIDTWLKIKLITRKKGGQVGNAVPTLCQNKKQYRFVQKLVLYIKNPAFP